MGGARRTNSLRDSTCSIDSNNAGRPNVSPVEGSGALPDLQWTSKKFVKLHLKHQPELQQTVERLEKCSSEFLATYSEVSKEKRRWRIATLIATIVTFFAHQVSSNTPHKNKPKGRKKLLEEVEKAVETFTTAADRVTSSLRIICKHAENSLEYQRDQQSSQTDLSMCEDDLSVFFEIFQPGDLWRLLDQGTKTLDGMKNIKQFVLAALPLIKDSRVQQRETEFVEKIRDVINYMRDTLNDTMLSKTLVEWTVMPKLNAKFE